MSYCPHCKYSPGMRACECDENLEPVRYYRMSVDELFERTLKARGEGRDDMMRHLSLRSRAEIWRAARDGSRGRVALAYEVVSIGEVEA